MSFYSYKNATPACCPGSISGNALDGLQERVCVQVKRVYDSALSQQQIDNAVVTITSFAQVSSGCSSNSCSKGREDNGTRGQRKSRVKVGFIEKAGFQ